MSKLTSKELSAIEDQLGAEHLLITKYRMASGNVSDKTLSSTCEKIANKHQEHYDRLLSYLK